MNKVDLIELISNMPDTGLSKQTGKMVLEGILEGIATALSRGESVELPGFGKFEVKERAARTGRNPRTGESLEIAKSWSVHFKSAKALKDQVISAHRE